MHAHSVLKRGKEKVERDKSEGRLGISILDWVGGGIVIEASQMCFCFVATLLYFDILMFCLLRQCPTI